MPRSEKWIKGHPEQRVTKVARRALRSRLSSFWRYARLAAKKPCEDVEHVHALRVSARRAETALRVFGELVPRKESRKIRKMVRQLRRAAGEARDLDVLAQRFAEATDSGKQSSRVLKQIRRSRRAVQKGLLGHYRQAKRKRLTSRAKNLVRATEWRHSGTEPSFASVARESLTPIVDEFFAAGEADLTDVAVLHALRLRGKRLRYAMELLAKAFDKSFRVDVYPVFRDVQDRLGAINDHVTAIRIMTEWCGDSDRGQSELAQQLLASEELQLADARRDFREWWTCERVAELRAGIDQAISGEDQELRNATESVASVEPPV